MTDLAQHQINAMKAVRSGANVYGHGTARALREVHDTYPGLVIISKALDENPRRAKPAHLYAQLTADGLRTIGARVSQRA